MGIRSFLFRVWYFYVNKVDKNADILFMNYGYHDENENISLDSKDEKNRYSIQLYHRLVNTVNIENKDIIEVGSGRGGGLEYVFRRFKPAKAVGFELDRTAVKFANKHHKKDGLFFRQGNAMNLNIENQSVDMVLNVESSHRYDNMEKFLSEVNRVLKPGGFFLFTDFRYPHEMLKLKRQLNDLNYNCIDEKEINENVILSIDRDSERRINLVKKLTPVFLHKTALNFSGVTGSDTYLKIKNSSYNYFIFCLQKPMV
jgi:ubiquinone/menaquinone biosynthesis C-methylase UbiE